jgi:hypothetical protein
MSININPKIPTTGLILYLDGSSTLSYPGTGITFSDISRTQTIATMSSSVSFVNNGMLFTGATGSYVLTTPSAVTTSFTINAWINPTGISQAGVSNYLGIVNAINGYASRNRFLLKSDYTSLFFQTYDGVSDYNIYSDSFPSIQNKTSMVTVTYDGTNVMFYLNGQSILATPYALSITMASGLSNSSIGKGAVSDDYYFNGTIYNYSLYNRGLSSSEVSRLYSALSSRYGLI